MKQYNENPSEMYRSMRDDLSPYLFHYTNLNTPFLDWINILSDQMIKSKNPYICLTEAPATSMVKMLDYFNKNNGRFSKYCIGFDRNLLINRKGARPVIYGDSNEYAAIQKTGLEWRFVEFDLNKPIDFTWQREWRIKGNCFDFSDLTDINGSIILIGPDFNTIYHDATRNKNAFTKPKQRYKVFSFDHVKLIKDDLLLSIENLTNLDLSQSALNE